MGHRETCSRQVDLVPKPHFIFFYKEFKSVDFLLSINYVICIFPYKNTAYKSKAIALSCYRT